MDLEDLLGVVGAVVALTVLVMLVLLVLDLKELHRLSAPPEAYAEKICTPVSFLLYQPANLVGALGVGPVDELRENLERLAFKLEDYCYNWTTEIVAKILDWDDSEIRRRHRKKRHPTENQNALQI